MGMVAGEVLGSWSAPGRVNLIGEHTDYNDGFALPIAIDRRATVTLALAGQDLTPSPYVAGVLSAMREDFDVPPLAITLESDVPIGAGLSSSAALTCATALGLNEAFGLGLSRSELVLIAQRAENRYVGAPTGILDQTASLLCAPGHALLLDCRDHSTRQIPLDLGDLRLFVVDTGVTHALAEGATEDGTASYADRRRECEAAAQQLGVGTLSEASSTGDLTGPLQLRARHVISENQRVLDAVSCLEDGKPDRLGELFTASHVSLRDDFQVSWPEADQVVESALAAGALGARMIGGGFGGSVLVLTPDAARAAVQETLSDFSVHEVGAGPPARREPLTDAV